MSYALSPRLVCSSTFGIIMLTASSLRFSTPNGSGCPEFRSGNRPEDKESTARRDLLRTALPQALQLPMFTSTVLGSPKESAAWSRRTGRIPHTSSPTLTKGPR